MKKIIAPLSAAIIAVAALGASMVPAEAASPVVGAQFTQVAAHPKPRFEAHGSYAYYNGHRGYRTFHPGYRQYNGYWFPPGAFVVGAIIGGILSNIH